MSARNAMTHRCDIQRDTNSGRGEGRWGMDAPPTWDDHLLNLSCRFWFDDTGRTQTVMDGDKAVELNARYLMVPEGTDVTPEDRITTVKDRRGRELAPGPMRIDSVGRRDGHLICRLMDVS